MKALAQVLLISVALCTATACCGSSSWWQSIGQCSACDNASPDWN